MALQPLHTLLGHKGEYVALLIENPTLYLQSLLRENDESQKLDLQMQIAAQQVVLA